MYACIHVPNLTEQNPADLIEVAKSFSPLIEVTDHKTVVLSVDALRRYIGPPHQIASEIARRAAERNLTGNIGIANTIDTAVLAARNLPGVTIIPKGAESKYIGAFRIETLPLDAETYTVLDRWGIRTLGDLSALPDNDISERLGAAAAHLQQLARGAADRPLKPAPIGTSYEERFELEHELTLIEPLLFILSRLLNELCNRLLSHSMATTHMQLRLDLTNQTVHERTLQLPFATRDSKMMLKLLQFDLEAHPPGAPVIAVALSVTPVEPRIIQNGLYTPLAPEPEKLELTLAKIRSMVGGQNAGSPELLNTHRPGAWRMRSAASGQWSVASGQWPVIRKQRIAFRHFSPPLRARVEVDDNRPKRIFSQRVYGKVLQVAGPWRTSGDWWTGNAWDRDEWDIGLNDSGLYRIYMERPEESWFVEGAYD
jgi:protein ImuB